MNEVAMTNNETNLVSELVGNELVQYCSLVPKNKQEKKILFNAMNKPSEKISDNINKDIDIVHIYCEVVTMTIKETGEKTKAPRIVLIDDKGKTFVCVSFGIYNSIKKIINVFGEPQEWDEPLTVTVKQVSRGERKTMTLDIKD